MESIYFKSRLMLFTKLLFDWSNWQVDATRFITYCSSSGQHAFEMMNSGWLTVLFCLKIGINSVSFLA